MDRGRMEAFSDGVLAILITIMVIEFRAPHEPTLEALRPLVPKGLSYLLSFVFLGIYWNNHHHMLKAVHHVNGAVLWANLHLLFWLSIVPFTTAWMGETTFARWPVAAYGLVLLMSGIAYFLLARTLIRNHGRDSLIARAVGTDFKGIASVLLYAVAIPLAFAAPLGACAIYVVVALLWLVPDRRFERLIMDHERQART